MIALSRLKNAAHIDFHKSVCASLARQADFNSKLRRLLKVYREAIDKETSASARTYRSDIVAQIHEADTRRDEAYRHLRLMVKFLKFRKDDASQTAYATLQDACKKTFTSQITKCDRAKKLVRMRFFAVMLRQHAAAFAEFTDFQASLQMLEDANDACVQLSALRTAERSEFEAGLTLTARAETDRIYRLIVRVIADEKELCETLGDDADASTQHTLEIIEQHEKETRRYLKVTATWRRKRRVEEKEDRERLEE